MNWVEKEKFLNKYLAVIGKTYIFAAENYHK